MRVTMNALVLRGWISVACGYITVAYRKRPRGAASADSLLSCGAGTHGRHDPDCLQDLGLFVHPRPLFRGRRSRGRISERLDSRCDPAQSALRSLANCSAFRASPSLQRSCLARSLRRRNTYVDWGPLRPRGGTTPVFTSSPLSGSWRAPYRGVGATITVC
jgi:hypothetical protein